MPRDQGWDIDAHDQSTLLHRQQKEACVSLEACGWNFIWEKIWENCPPNKDPNLDFSSQGFNTFMGYRCFTFGDVDMTPHH